MAHTSSPDTSHGRPPLAAILLVPVLVALALTMFAWPASRQEPRDLPVGVVGTGAPAQEIEQRLGTREGAFEIHRYVDVPAAREAIRDREVYGAFVPTPLGPGVLVATGASVTVSQVLEQVVAGAGGSARGEGRVEDVVSGSAEDPRGAGLAASVLPLVLAGLLVGLLAVFLAPTFRSRAALVAIGSVLSGFAAIVIAQWWLGVVESNWLANWAVLSLLVLAIAALVAGLEALIGTAGIGVAALIMILIGNPLAAVSSAPQMLPQPLGDIGQLLPPGAGGNLLRSTAFFDGADAAGHIVVLAVWVLIGLAALAAAAMRKRRLAPQSARLVTAS
jgi:hypothetical protein